MPRYYLIFLLICTVGYNNVQVTAQIPIPGFSEIMGILKFCYKVAEKIKIGYELYEKHIEHKQDIMEMIMANISDIPFKLDQMESRLSQKMDVMVQTLLNRLPIIGKLDASMRELHNYVVRVDGMYDNYVYYSKDKNNFNDYTIKRFINSVTSENLGDLQDVLNKMHRLVLPDRTSHIRESLLLLISKQTAVSLSSAASGSGIQLISINSLINLFIFRKVTWNFVMILYHQLNNYTNCMRQLH